MGSKTSIAAVGTAALLVVLASSSLATDRTWTSRDGASTIEAEPIDYKPGWIKLRKTDGKELAVPLSQLSEVDQAYVRELIKGYRVWTSRDRQSTIFAKFLDEKQGWLRLEKIDGKETSVELNKLAREDREWVSDALARGPEKSGGKSESVGDEPLAIGPQTLAMETLRINPPQPGKRLSRDTYLLLVTTPQLFHMEPGEKGSHDAEFARIVRSQPTYQTRMPQRGVARLGSHDYAFVLDAVGQQAAGYNQLYFDLNRNGDLTDDEPIPAVNVSGNRVISQSQFPRVDLKVDVGDGTECDYSFFISSCWDNSPKPFGSEKSTISASLYSAVVREGHISEGKKQRRLVLVDRNCNGTFNDRVSLRRSGSRISQTEGDLLLVDPKPKDLLSGDATMGEDRHYVSKTVCVGKQFFRMELPPAGSQLTLEPTELALGYVTNSSPAYRAVVHSNDYGVLMIGGVSGAKVPLPEGSWKVATYTIDATHITGGRRTAVTATFENDGQGVTVKKEDTVPLKFGQPFRAKVRGYRMGGNKVSLSLSIVGVGGERCTSFYINGNRPPEPVFTVSTPEGKIVHQGKFEYG